VKEAKDDARRMYSEALDTKKTLLLMNDTLRVTFESEMLAMREEHNRLVESLKERDDTVQQDLIEVDQRLNRHRRALNELDTKVGATSPGLQPRELTPLLG
jgi:primosomal protein N''